LSNNGVRSYDTLFNQTGILNNFPRRPFEISADNNGRIYISVTDSASNADYYSHSISSIYIFNQNEIIKRLNLNDTLDSIPALGFGASLFTVSNNGNIIFVNNTQDSILICDSVGSILKIIGGFGSGFKEGITTLATDQINNIYVYEVGKGISVYDADGDKLRFFNTKFHQIISKINVDPRNGNIYFCVSGIITVYSPEGLFVTRFNLTNGQGHHLVLSGNKIYVLSGNGVYYDATETSDVISSVLKLTNNLP
jgi:hypothetical protein